MNILFICLLVLAFVVCISIINISVYSHTEPNDPKEIETSVDTHRVDINDTDNNGFPDGWEQALRNEKR